MRLSQNLSNICGGYPYKSFGIGRIQNLVAFKDLFNLSFNKEQYKKLLGRIEEIRQNSLQHLTKELSTILSSNLQELNLGDEIKTEGEVMDILKSKYSNFRGLDEITRGNMTSSNFTSDSRLKGYFFDEEYLKNKNYLNIQNIFLRQKSNKGEFLKILMKLSKVYGEGKQKQFKTIIYDIFTQGDNCFDIIYKNKKTPSQYPLFEGEDIDKKNINQLTLDCIPTDSVGANITVKEKDINKIKEKIEDLKSSIILPHKTELGENENSHIFVINGTDHSNYAEIRIQTLKNRLEGVYGSKNILNHITYKYRQHKRVSDYLESCYKVRCSKNPMNESKKEFYNVALNLFNLYGFDPDEFFKKKILSSYETGIFK